MKSPLHFRSLRGLSIREAPAGSGHIGILEGYAAVFDSDSVEFAGWEKPWIERVAPGAFTRTLRDRPDVRAFWYHDPAAPIARAPLTLRLTEDSTGLAVEMHLIDTSRNRDLLADVRSGLVDAMSFGFYPVKTDWEETETREIRTLVDVDLEEVSPVVYPAYPATSLTARASGALYPARRSDAAHDLTAIRAERDAFFRAASAAQKSTHHPAAHWERRLGLLAR